MSRREIFHKKLSPLVSDRLPDFVRGDYPTFVSFIKKYYEWAEQDEFPTERISSLLSFRDIDDSPEPFISYLQNEYLDSFPTSFVANKRLIIKNIKEYNKAKGTPDAFKFLFRVLYATEISILIPWNKVVVVSGAPWQLDTTLKLATYFGAAWTNAVGSTITQATTGATAIIDGIRQRWENSTWVTELYLHNIVGTFNQTDRVTTTYIESAITKTVYGDPLDYVLSGLTINSGGTGYLTGDQLIFTSVCDGAGAKGYASAVDEDGAITEVTLNEFGIRYLIEPTVTVQSSAGTGVDIDAVVGAIATYPGYYINGTGGLLSDGYVLQDSEYYQKFSYVIQTEYATGNTDMLTMKKYGIVAKATGHPAGMKLYSRVALNNSVDAAADGTVTSTVESTSIPDYSSSSSS